MNATIHAIDRTSERLAECGEDPRLVMSEARRIAAAHADKDLAVRMRVLDTAYGDTSGGSDRQSNGDEVWAVCRHGVVRTMMLRRSSQPRTPDAFRVDLVLRVALK